MSIVEWIRQLPAFNTSGSEYVPKICVDSSCNTYIAYYTDGAISGGTNIAGTNDIVVLKLDASGDRVWASQNATINTSANDYYPSICVDSNANTYIAYYTDGVVSGGTNTTFTNDIVVLKLDTSGDRVWASQNATFNTAGSENNPSICVDNCGNTYIAYSTTGAVSGGTNIAGTNDIVVLKLDASGDRVWASQNATINTAGSDNYPQICVDSSFNTYIAYYTDGVVSGGTNTGSSYDIVVMKLDASGDRVWASQNATINTAGNDYYPSICVDSQANTYLAYYTDGVVSGGTNIAGTIDIVVLKLDASGDRVWASQNSTFNTDGQEYFPRICIDNCGNTYISYFTTGLVSSGTHPGGSSYDIVVLKLDSSGDRIWAMQNPSFNTPGSENMPSICCDNKGNAYVAFMTDAEVSGGTNSGSSDIVIMKLHKPDQLSIYFVDTPQTPTITEVYITDAQCLLPEGYSTYLVYNTTSSQDQRTIFHNGQNVHVQLSHGNLAVDGQYLTIDLSGVTDYYGLCSVRDASAAEIRNFNVHIGSSSTLAKNGGYICAGETSGPAGLTVGIYNCRVVSDADINIDVFLGGNLAGSNGCIIGGYNMSGTFTILDCYTECAGALIICKTGYGSNGLIMGGENSCGDITIKKCSARIGGYANINEEGNGLTGFFLGGFNNAANCNVAIENCTCQIDGSLNLVDPTQGPGYDGFILGGYNPALSSIYIRNCIICCNTCTLIANDTKGCRVIIGDSPGTSSIEIDTCALICTSTISCQLPLLSANTISLSGCKVYYGALNTTGSDTTATEYVPYSMIADVSAYNFVDANAMKWQILVNDTFGIEQVNQYALKNYNGSQSGILTVNIAEINGENIVIPTSSPLNIFLPMLSNMPYMVGASKIMTTRDASGNPVFLLNGTPIAINDDMQINGHYYQLLAAGSALLKPFIPIPCFTGDARIMTARGEIQLGSLRRGDRVLTGDKRFVAFVRLHRRIVPSDNSTRPYVIPPGMYGANRELLISPNHRVLTEHGMLAARKLGLRRRFHRGTIEYLNVVLQNQDDTMIVNGVIVESLSGF
jgi:hypothetical protein